MISFLAAIPDLQSAIKVDGGSGGCVRLQLDLYINSPQSLSELLLMRGKELEVTMVPVEDKIKDYEKEMESRSFPSAPLS